MARSDPANSGDRHGPPITGHADVDAVLNELSVGLQSLLGDQLIGVYLTGSLTYGDFDRGSSDIDYLAILRQPLAMDERRRLKELHELIGETWPEWQARVEGSYVTADMLDSVDPPSTPRPYINGGQFWEPDPRYGNEWLINLRALHECGVALVGPDVRSVMKPIDIEDVREASRRDLVEEWIPKLHDPGFFESSHHQAYVTLTLCRILHRAEHEGVVSKRIASAWVKETYDEPWIVELVERAERWRHGEEMGSAEQVMRFIEFTRERLTS